MGIIAGFTLGVRVALSLGFKPCGGSCDGETAEMGVSLVGLPILGAYLGARFAPHAPWSTVYRSR